MEKAFSPAPRRALAVALAGLAGCFLFVSLRDTLSWIGRPYPGFLLFPNAVISSIQPLNKEGGEAVTYPGYITGADGKRVGTSNEVYRLARGKGASRDVLYMIERDGKSFSARIPVRVFTVRDFMSVLGVCYFTGLIFLGVGLFFLWIAPIAGPSGYLAGLAISTGLWAGLTPDLIAEHRFTMFFYPASALMAPFFILFGLSFPEQRKTTGSVALKAVLWGFLFLVLLSYYLFLYRPDIYIYCDLSLVMETGLGAVVVVISTLHGTMFSPSIESRKKARVVVWGVALIGCVFVPSVVFLWVYSRSEAGYFIALSGLIFFFFLAYSSLKHNIFEIDEAVRKWAGYLLVISVISALYIGLLSGLSLAFSWVGVGQVPTAVVSALLIVVVFNPLRDRVKLFVDRTFFRGAYEAQKIVEEVSEALVTILDLGTLLERLLGAVCQAMGADRASVLLSEREGYAVAYAKPPLKNPPAALKSAHPLIMLLSAKKREAILKGGGAASGNAEDALKALGAEAVIPLVYRDSLAGALVLGGKRSGASYTSGDVRMLRALADQAALAIENARLHKEEKEKERMVQELASARKIQMGLLPQREPKVDGLDLSGVSVAAKEVGGDYYDYILLTNGELGMAIGDVAGKGAPAALVMTMIKGAFHSNLEAVRRPGEMLQRLNKIACSSGSKQMVTFFYCVVNSKEKWVRFSNAGHNFPYLLRDGRTRFIGEPADFPLGVDPVQTYTESQVGLLPRDTLVFYTDGIVEARSAAGEREKGAGEKFFGFDRLEEAILRHAGSHPGKFKEAIMAEVDRFCGGHEPADDMTLVIVSLT